MFCENQNATIGMDSLLERKEIPQTNNSIVTVANKYLSESQVVVVSGKAKQNTNSKSWDSQATKLSEYGKMYHQ